MERALFGEGRRRSLGGRSSECALLDDLVSAVRCGNSQSLVLRGEAGIGKTALLEYLLDSAPDLTVLRATGIESEMELAFASLASGELLGNFPQAFSHIGLINAAWRIDEACRNTGEPAKQASR